MVIYSRDLEASLQIKRLSFDWALKDEWEFGGLEEEREGKQGKYHGQRHGGEKVHGALEHWTA